MPGNSANQRTAAILTLGCKLNLADSEAMALRLRRAGWQVTNRPGPADAVIVNSCSVTQMADQKSRHLVRQARRSGPDAIVALTGCMVETAATETLDALGVDLVYRQPEQANLADRLIELLPTQQTLVTELPRALKTRAFIAAQQGCNDVCAFCIIPRTRGRERSKSVADVVAEAKLREAEGVQELVITGTQLGAYGRDHGAHSLYALLRALLDETSIPRIRLSSVQPQDLSPDLIGLWRDDRLCRHFHLALQSGCDATLKRMRRRYDGQQFREAISELREDIPGVAITTDVIAGFPGETDAEFAETYAFCREMRFSAMHVFPYSQRLGTLAEKLPNQVEHATKKDRVQRLIALGQETAAEFRQRLSGATVKVLWEHRNEAGAWEGLTDTYVRVACRSEIDLHNKITAVRIEERPSEVLWAEAVDYDRG